MNEMKLIYKNRQGNSNGIMEVTPTNVEVTPTNATKQDIVVQKLLKQVG